MSASPPVRGLPAKALVAAIRAYQRTLSPLLPILTLGRGQCRFAPTCSHYAIEALREHGAWHGVWLALRRLARCTPLHAGGLDPVPRRCVRLTPAASPLPTSFSHPL